MQRAAVVVQLDLLVDRTQLAAVDLERLLSGVAGVEIEDGLGLADRGSWRRSGSRSAMRRGSPVGAVDTLRDPGY